MLDIIKIQLTLDMQNYSIKLRKLFEALAGNIFWTSILHAFLNNFNWNRHVRLFKKMFN